MPTFATPEPIDITVELGAGDIRITAGDRTDTVVEVRPSDPASDCDVSAAGQTRVEYSAGSLLVKTPKTGKRYGFPGTGGSVGIEIKPPSGSRVRGSAGAAALRSEGRLGECRFKTGAGDIQLGHTGALHLVTTGDITVHQAAGDAEATTGAGTVRIGEIGGTAVIKSAGGDIRVGRIAGELHAKSASGNISVEHAGAEVHASTAKGDVRIGDVARGTVTAKTAYGNIEVGICDGTAAWLDVSTHFGTVHNHLEDAEPPGRGEATADVTARTAYGDIVIRRSQPS